MFWNFLGVFLLSMVPILELRGALPIGIGYAMASGIPEWVAYVICVIGNMIPVPFVYFFARKFLVWGSDKKVIGKFFRFCLEKGEHAGKKLTNSAGKQGGLLIALTLFVGIPLPGTGAWTGTLAASFLDMGIKKTTAAVSLGVIISGIIMGLLSAGVFTAIGF